MAKKKKTAKKNLKKKKKSSSKKVSKPAKAKAKKSNKKGKKKSVPKKKTSAKAKIKTPKTKAESKESLPKKGTAKKAKEKETAVIADTIQEKPIPSLDPAKEKARLKAIAKAREAIKAKEKQKNSVLPIDKAAAEKQLKLAEPKNKLVLEYIIHSSPALLYEFITSPSGLSEWFADNVNVTGSMYSFYWEGAEQKARVLAAKENKSIRFQWTDRPPAAYFELRIEKNELTEELSLIITDFAESADEMNSLEVLWQGQVLRLMKVIGSKI